MKKEDLKTCDVVEVRDGDIYILLKGNFMGNELAFMDVEDGCFIGLDSYNNNLCNMNDKNFDIMKVKRFDYTGDVFRALGMIEGYKKQEMVWDWIRPESYNARIVCINSQTDHFTKGKIYKVENGNLYGNGNKKFDGNVQNIDEVNEGLMSKFIELVEV